MKKVCKKCLVEKDLEEFYKNERLKDGHEGRCIECAKKNIRKAEILKLSVPGAIELERERQKEKYRRLNYKEKQKNLHIKI